ncbi:hypothetical protein [Microbacterium sp. NPDC056052]|uniref:hypothetical protein n=1 Tax=Microbacterium sp. NPDC056052 TaxID=3345695 RepID=UPI0035D8EBF1
MTKAMEDEPCDVLGKLYMQLELGNSALGQFYTPYSVAQLIAVTLLPVRKSSAEFIEHRYTSM